jgi:RNA polymerase sigma factor (sigma-70 family)
MKLATATYEFDVSKMEDEALVVLERECPHLGARYELILRHFPRVTRHIATLARSTGLGREDTEEAQQNAEVAIEEAIRQYDLGQLARQRGKTFRQYLRQVVWARFRDFVKHIRRENRHYDHSSAAVHALKEAIDNGARRVRSGGRDNAQVNDPAQTAILKEERERLQNAVSQLSEDCRMIWEALCDGKKLAQIAEALRLSDDQANHRKRKMYAQLFTLLGKQSLKERQLKQ